MDTLSVQNSPVTESSNELTVRLGSSTTEMEILRALRGSDLQIFSGWHEHIGLLDAETIEKIENGAHLLHKVLSSKKGRVIISGCGTSGRIACMTCTYVNRMLKENGQRECCEFLCSGGEASLVISNEFHEDDPHVGAKDLQSKMGHEDGEIVYIGITCGLSAPYVAGQIDWLLHKKSSFEEDGRDSNDNINIILIGFNPSSQARKAIIEEWDSSASPSLTGSKSFYDIVFHLENKSNIHKNCLIINPIVGPEPISGSTRMKGGSATKIILDVMFASAVQTLGIKRLVTDAPINNSASSIKESLLTFSDVCHRTYLEAHNIAEIASLASKCINRNNKKDAGHVYYIGKSIAGVIGIVDASEMPDTFGSPFTEFRGFVHGGWSDMGSDESSRKLNPLLHISTADFWKEIIPQLSENDLVIGLSIKNCKEEEIDDELEDVLLHSIGRNARVGLLQVFSLSQSDGMVDLSDTMNTNEVHSKSERSLKGIKEVSVGLPLLGITSGRTELAEFSLKIMVNAVSTAAQIMNGKVVSNQMINFSPLNNKLYQRSLKMIKKLTGLENDHLVCECLLKAIYKTDVLPPDRWHDPISTHVLASTPTGDEVYEENNIMPIALLLAADLVKRRGSNAKEECTGGLMIQDAIRILKQNSKIVSKKCIL